MTDPRKVREALDAVRSEAELASSDMAELRCALADSPECREAWRGVRRADEAIGRALRDVEIPDGLEARLMARLAASSSGVAESPVRDDLRSGDPPVAAAVSVERSPDGSFGRRASRRAWWGAAGAVIALGLGVWAIQAFRASPAVAPDLLGFEAIAWQESLTESWLDMSESRPTPRPLDRQVRFAPRGWQRVATRWDAACVAYDLSRRQGAATLFVLSPPTLPAELNLSATRVPATGGWGAAAWRNGDRLYVLVVEERGQKLEDYLRASASQIVAAPGVPDAGFFPG